jgi:hypothetical protein
VPRFAALNPGLANQTLIRGASLTQLALSVARILYFYIEPH